MGERLKPAVLKTGFSFRQAQEKTQYPLASQQLAAVLISSDFTQNHPFCAECRDILVTNAENLAPPEGGTTIPASYMIQK